MLNMWGLRAILISINRNAMPSKPKLKTQKSALSNKDLIISAALKLAAVQSWRFITVRDIADEAGITLSSFYDSFDNKEDIIVAYGRRLDQKVLEVFSDLNPETPARDALFDIIMERFDLANQDRTALKSILDSFRADPKMILFNLSHLGMSMTRMLEAAGLDAYGAKGAARVAGLTAAAVWVTRVWLEDETRDLSKTMAALDKALSRIENFANRFNL